MSDAFRPDALAAEIVTARASGRTLSTPFSGRSGPPSLPQSYEVQRHVTAARLARGERVVGWKLGYTSLAMRAQMGVDAPNYGPLTDAMLLPSGDALPGGELQPRVEPEIGMRFARRLTGECSLADVLSACDSAVACLEVVDSVWDGYRFTLEDNTADGSSAAWVAVGPELPPDDLAAIEVALSVDGREVDRATGAAASGHPAAGVVWLAARLAEQGLAIEPGHLVITGGLTRAVPLDRGSRIEARFSAGGQPAVHVLIRRPQGQPAATGDPARTG